MRNPDFTPAKATFSASRLNGEGVAASLRDFGCALLKGLFTPRALRKFDERIERNSIGADQALRAAGAPEHFNVGFPLYFAGVDPKEKVHACLTSSYPQIFEPSRMQGMDCASLPAYVFSVLGKTGLGEIIRRHLGQQRLCTSAAICHVRKFDAPLSDIREAEKRLLLHQDSFFYNTTQEILTLWFPFRYEHGAMASLEFLPVKTTTILPCTPENGIDQAALGPEAFWRPAYELGDAVLISGYSPHHTYYPATTCKARTSIDVRFFATSVPEPIYAHRAFLRWLHR